MYISNAWSISVNDFWNWTSEKKRMRKKNWIRALENKLLQNWNKLNCREKDIWGNRRNKIKRRKHWLGNENRAQKYLETCKYVCGWKKSQRERERTNKTHRKILIRFEMSKPSLNDFIFFRQIKNWTYRHIEMVYELCNLFVWPMRRSLCVPTS